MIKSFKCKETAHIWDAKKSKKFPADVQSRALKKLYLIDAAMTLDDLRQFPGNRVEFLSGNRKGQVSIRINDQWRICFVWNKNDAEQVEIVDYH